MRPGPRFRHPPHLARPSAILASMVLLAGCGDAPNEEGVEPIVRDSAGIAIVDSPVPDRGEADGWRIAPEPAVTIGDRDGEDPYLFADVQGAGQLADGRIYVLDWAPHFELRWFDPRGRFLEAWGGRGQGPEEFFLPPRQVVPYRGDSVAVLVDVRLSVFDADGGFGRHVPLRDDFPPTTDRGRRGQCCIARASLEDGSWIVEYPEEHALEGDGSRGEVRLVRISPEGELIQELGVFPGGRWYEASPERTARMFRGVHSGGAAVAVAGERILVGDPLESRIEILDPEGQRRRSIRIQRERPELDDEARRAYEAGLRAEADGHAASEAIVRDQVGSLPERLPAFDRILMDPDDRLWLISETVAFASAFIERALVLEPDGAVLGEVELPPDVRVVQVGRDQVIGIAEGEMDVPRVVLHRIQR